VIALGIPWVVIMVLSRFLLSYAGGPDSLRQDLALFVRGYLLDLFSPEFVITLLLAMLVWYLTAEFLDLLDEIGLDMEVALRETQAHIQSEGVPAHQRLVSLIFSIGIGLVIMTALTRLNLRTIFASTSGMPAVELSRFSGGEASALLYFVFGLALLSLSRLMSLQTHWNRLRIPVSSRNLTRQWAMYSLFFLLILAIIVNLLPSGDSLGFFALLGTVLSFLMVVLVFVTQLILALLLLLFSLPFLLFGKVPPTFMRSTPPALPTLPPQPLYPTTGNMLWELLKSILLWGSLIVILIFSFVRYLKQHDGLLAVLRKSRITNWLVLAWQWIYRNADKTRGTLARVIQDGWQSVVSRLEGRRLLPQMDFIRLRSLDPRRQIYFFYLAMIRRGNEQGFSRKPSQTPSEYAASLEKNLPTESEDIDAITKAFEEARYSRHEVNTTDADFVKATWARIRRALQTKSKSG
jgi:hypothetical protein